MPARLSSSCDDRPDRGEGVRAEDVELQRLPAASAQMPSLPFLKPFSVSSVVALLDVVLKRRGTSRADP